MAKTIVKKRDRKKWNLLLTWWATTPDKIPFASLFLPLLLDCVAENLHVTRHQWSINATKCSCIRVSWREAKNSNSPWHAVSDHDPVDTEEEHPLGHHYQPSIVKLIHRAFSGCKRANSSRAPRKYNCRQKVTMQHGYRYAYRYRKDMDMAISHKTRYVGLLFF